MILVLPAIAFGAGIAGWAVLHLIWQGLLVGSVAAFILRLLRPAVPVIRERVALAAIVVLGLLFGATALAVIRIALAPSALVEEALAARALPHAGRLDAVAYGIAAFAPFLGLLWAILIAIRVRSLYQAAQRIRVVRARATTTLDGPAALACERVARSMHARPVPVRLSVDVEVPTLVGWRRPLILLPAAIARDFSPAAIAGLVAHELAHVQRADIVIHALQTAARVLFFFHPVVHWLGRVIESEREHCCDDLAIAAGNSPLDYSRALARLERVRRHPAEWALAADGGLLLHRVRRLVEPRASLAGRRAWALAAIGVACVVATAAFAARVVPNASPAAGPLRGLARHLMMEMRTAHGLGAKPLHKKPHTTAAARALLESMRDVGATDDARRIRIRAEDSIDPPRRSDLKALAQDPDPTIRDRARKFLPPAAGP